MIIAQISDTHIVAPGKLFRCPVQGSAADSERVYREFDTAAYLARAVATLNALVPRPDVAVVTGDLVDHGEPEEYEHLRAVLRPLAMPVFVIPGNHDVREPLREAFRDARYLPADGTCNSRSKITQYGLSRSTRSSPVSMAGCCAPSDWVGSTLRSRRSSIGRP